MSRFEELLEALVNGETSDIIPASRTEAIIKNCLEGLGSEGLPDPESRVEAFLTALAVKMQGGTGGGDDTSALDALIDRSITEISSNVETIGLNAFYQCAALATANFPLATTIDGNAFYYCSALATANFPSATTIGRGAFYGCSALATANFPSATTIDTQAFYYCSALATADFSLATTIASKLFYYCCSLTALILRSEIICTLSNTNAFTGCYRILGEVNEKYNPDGLKDGYIYVPAALVDSYKAATNWSTYADNFRALEDYTVDGTITGELNPTKI